jgi:hypothetical protein
MSSGKSDKKSTTKLCKASCLINTHSDSAPSRRNAKAAAFGGGSLLGALIGFAITLITTVITHLLQSTREEDRKWKAKHAVFFLYELRHNRDHLSGLIKMVVLK